MSDEHATQASDFIDWCALHGFGLQGWPEGSHAHLVASLNAARFEGYAAGSADMRETAAQRCTTFEPSEPFGGEGYDAAIRMGDALATAIRAFPLPDAPEPQDYQSRVMAWLLKCFGPGITNDRVERVHRFWEESLELGQSAGCTAAEAHQLVDYVFGRPIGEMRQEIGGTLVCLAALCAVYDVDLNAEGERELARVWTKVEKIRAKHAAKPKFSPLPGMPPALPSDAEEVEHG